MKKEVGCWLLTLTCGLLMVACSGGGSSYKIGVSQCGTGQWREKVNQEMLAAQHLYDEDAEVVIACAYDDTERQIRQIDSLANVGIDLLVVAPNEAAPLSEAIAKVRAKGIPVIYFDRKAGTEDYTAFIGGNNVEAGRACGDYAKEQVRYGGAGVRRYGGTEARVMEITGAMTSSPARERHEGFAESMKEYEGVKYEMREGDWTSDKACEIMEGVIGTAEQPDIVFCHNDGMAVSTGSTRRPPTFFCRWQESEPWAKAHPSGSMPAR
ncbi:MAG: substrate-binding domain-containing protein [Prevotella sp.]|nr:substrate-binding domain-containing protein [Prevotella sp.]